MKKRAHVHQHNIRSNKKLLNEWVCGGKKGPMPTLKPPFTIKTYKENMKGFGASFIKDGKEVATLLYRPLNPLPCGAQVWIETDCDVIVIGEEKLKEEKKMCWVDLTV